MRVKSFNEKFKTQNSAIFIKKIPTTQRSQNKMGKDKKDIPDKA